MANFDSELDTRKHIARVQALLIGVAQALLQRALEHDASKLQEPEKSAFDELTPLLAGTTYGTPEYKALLERLGPALQHHYAHNRHHPEYHALGVGGMTLVDLVEMFCDWKAASERHADGDIVKSIGINAGRFALADQLAAILYNTARELGEG